MLPDTPGAGALALADPVTISIGVSVPAAGEAFEAALGRADQALYLAKIRGTEPRAHARCRGQGRGRCGRRARAAHRRRALIQAIMARHPLVERGSRHARSCAAACARD